MTTYDFLIPIAWLAGSLLIRWAVLSGPGWARLLVGVAVIAGINTATKLNGSSIGKSIELTVAILLFLGFSAWFSQYPWKLLRYIFRVVRGASIQAKAKADKLAEMD